MDCIIIEVEDIKMNCEEARKKQLFRYLTYQMYLVHNKQIFEKKSWNFWDRESCLERRIYQKIKEWERRHPIIGLFICTVLMGILISLLAESILEAIY